LKGGGITKLKGVEKEIYPVKKKEGKKTSRKKKGKKRKSQTRDQKEKRKARDTTILSLERASPNERERRERKGED